jgi:CRISPR/Cas system CSM-associated protein Csm4 (group 5 of RAMP superfamily)
MKAIVIRTSDWYNPYEPIREFESLETALKILREETKQSEYVVRRTFDDFLREERAKEAEWVIEIYDAYRE